MKIDRSLFRTYDIRGTYNKNLNEKDAFFIGWALIKYTKAKTLLVSNDPRPSGDSLKKAFIKGALFAGIEKIYDAGMTSTPISYFGNSHLKVDASAMITASHCPPEMNGFKMCQSDSLILDDQELVELYDLISAFKEDINIDGIDLPEVERIDLVEPYTRQVTRNFKFSKEFKIISDTANYSGIFEQKPLEVFPQLNIKTIFADIDVAVPNHIANPMKDNNIKALSEKVIEEKADLGIAFDGDADRIIFVDEKGKRVQADIIIAVIATMILKENKGASILYDLRSSKVISDIVEKYYGHGRITPVGNTVIKRMMRDDNSLFAAELAGHFHFKETFYSESCALPALYVFKYLEETGMKLSEVEEKFSPYEKLHETNFEHHDKDGLLELFKDKYNHDCNLITIDGYLFDYGDWWFSVRKSANDPVVRFVMEAKDSKVYDEKKSEIFEFFNEQGAILERRA